MSIVTNWGYELPDAESLPDLLNLQEFDVLTGNRYARDIRVPLNIKAACAAIRNYVGWHMYPAESCKLDIAMDNRRITFVGRDILVQLPAKFVTSVESITIGETVYENYTIETNGILRIYDVAFCHIKRYDHIVILYTAGLTDSMMDGIKELVAHRVTHATASSNGITSEAAGGVSVTYNANWVNSARATALPSDNKEVLEPYRVQGVF